MALWLMLAVTVLLLQPFRVVSGDCPDDDVSFYLYTRSNRESAKKLTIDSSCQRSDLSSYFNSSHPVKVLINGYNSDFLSSPMLKIKHEYLARGDYNVIYVEWSKLSRGWYHSVEAITPHVGRCIAQMIVRITEAGSKNIHLLGFSLGALVANYVSVAAKPIYIDRITGLDPAKPLLIGKPERDRLDRSDARYVDVYHTDTYFHGRLERCGDVDFYFNKGSHQPSCGGWDYSCSHHRAIDYYAESIRSTRGFWGYNCDTTWFFFGSCKYDDIALAGEHVSRRTTDWYNVPVNADSPYAKGYPSGNESPMH